MWLMSPPCQPFTRNNTTNSRDTNDPRSKAFIHLTDLLSQLRIPPQYIALEVLSLLFLFSLTPSYLMFNFPIYLECCWI